MKKIYILFFISFIFIATGFAQDLHLSQFYTADHMLNPAKVGAHDGQYRVSANMRNQWRQFGKPINTNVIAADNTFNYYSHSMDGGIMFARDEFSRFGQVVTEIHATAAYEYPIDDHIFRIGIQPGLVLRQTDLSKQTFPEQWNYVEGTFDPSWSNQETNIAPSLAHFDLNMGIMWSNALTDKLNINAGIAFNHLNRPKNTYFNEHTERLKVRTVIHSEVDYQLNDLITISPKLLLMVTTKTNETLIGSNVSYKLSSDKFTRAFAGLYYRHGIIREFDALYPIVGLSYGQFDFGFSYDFNMSEISTLGAKGTYEFSLIYTAPNFKPRFKTLPCERY